MRYIRSLTDHSFNKSSEVTDSPNQDVYLSKRVITSVTQAELPEYLYDQFDENPDQLFGSPAPLTTDKQTDATVTRQRIFNKKNAFQIGSQALHGCTVVTVISKRAVYMVRESAVFASQQKSLKFGTGTLLGKSSMGVGG